MVDEEVMELPKDYWSMHDRELKKLDIIRESLYGSRQDYAFVECNIMWSKTVGNLVIKSTSPVIIMFELATPPSRFQMIRIGWTILLHMGVSDIKRGKVLRRDNFDPKNLSTDWLGQLQKLDIIRLEINGAI